MKNLRNLLVMVVAVMAMFTVNAVYAFQPKVGPDVDAAFNEMLKLLKTHNMKVNYCGLSENMLNSTIYITTINNFDSRTSTQTNMTGTIPFIRLKNLLIMLSTDPTVKSSGITHKDRNGNIYYGFTISTPGNQTCGYLFAQQGDQLYIKYLVVEGRADTISTQAEKFVAGDTLKNLVENFLRNAAFKKK